MVLNALAINLLCLVLQAFFAGAEMAVISCNRIRMRHRAEMGEKRAMIIQRFLEEPRYLLATTLVGYNFAVVTGSCVLTNIISHYVPPHTENIFSLAINWPLVLILGQIVPMAYGRQHADSVSLATARPLLIASYLLFPLTYIASSLGKAITRIFTRGSTKKNPFVTREELELILKEGHEAGVLEKQEKEMIEEIFHFGEITARQIMVPLIDVTAAPETATVGQLDEIVKNIGHSRIPVYRERIDNLVGIVHVNNLIGISPDRPIRDFITPPCFFPETASIEKVLTGLQGGSAYMAIVVDEYGGASGIITIEDIVEEIVGEIEDEYDTDEGSEWQNKAESIVVGGRMRIAEFNEEFGQLVPEETVETIGGFVTDLLGRFPRSGDEVSYDNLKFRVTEATDRRAVRIEVRGAKRESG